MTRPSTPRRVKTPAQRAEEQLAIAERAVQRLDAKWDDLDQQCYDVGVELAEAKRRRDYLAQHPDLPANQTEQTANQTVQEN